MAATVYRFLPWSRRGLAAALPGAAAAAPLPARAEVAVKVVVAGAGEAQTTARLHGPGDVIGLDPTQVIRTFPQRHATNVEPNYLAAVDFDAPELPWLFTPAGAPADQRLAPWLVLVVVEDRPGVRLNVPPGAPLPQLRIDSGAAEELPDLAEAWAWGHAQLLDSDAGNASPAAVGAGLADHPDGNVSRLVCPRRLEAGRRWVAALVPAYDAGVTRGLGGTPDPGADLGPAWASPDAVTLPVYYHWEFQTGVEGDFESLARRLKPYQASARVGLVPMHVGESAPPLRVPDGQSRVLDMDGALRAPAGSDGTLAQVPDALRTGLTELTRTLADAADGVLDGQTLLDASRQPVGPPVYASAHQRRWQVRDSDPEWFRELNLDPRPRVAAGLGADVLRERQEEVVHAAWQQVGDVLQAEAALQRAALSMLVSRSFHRRHIERMPHAGLLGLTAPMAARLPVAGRSLVARVRATSLPDAVLDPGLRRAVSPSGTGVANAARRLGVAPARLRTTTVAALSAGFAGVDPTRFDRPVITGAPSSAFEGVGDLRGIGLPVAVAPSALAILTSSARGLPPQPPPDDRSWLTLRPEVRGTGLLGQAHLDAARDLAAQARESVRGATAAGSPADAAVMSVASTAAVLDGMVSAAAAATATSPQSTGATRSRGLGLLVTGPQILPGTTTPAASPERAVTARVVDLDAGGRVVIRTEPGRPNIPIGRTGAMGRSTPIGRNFAIGRVDTGATAPAAPGTPGTPAGPAGPGAGGLVVPPLIRDEAVIQRFETAVASQLAHTVLGVAKPVATLVPFDLAAAMNTVRTYADPAVSQPLRRDALVSLAGRPVGSFARPPRFAVDGWWTPPQVDRVMTYPVFATPASGYLADYDRTRFCPGIDEIPTDSVTLLETNPRFIASFMAGLNHETNRELLWRGYPTDSRGTPFRRFWSRRDSRDDIPPLHEWRSGGLAAQTSDPKGNLVLLLRGDLLRRYPNTIVLALRAKSSREPSRDPDDALEPVFSGQFDPDVSFFGFPLVDTDLTVGEGWFFALMEPVTEPRFGLDETTERAAGVRPASWSDVAWPDTGVDPGGYLTHPVLSGLGLLPSPGEGGGVAAALFQRPFALYVHAKHLVAPLPVQQ